MPPLSRWFVKAGFVSLGLALLCELLLARPGGLWPALPGAALHLGAVHLLTVGWLVQFVLGVAYWMLPRHAATPERGSAPLAWGAFALFQCGLALAVVCQALSLRGIAPAAARPLLAGATFTFLGLLWGRVKPFAARCSYLAESNHWEPSNRPQCARMGRARARSSKSSPPFLHLELDASAGAHSPPR